MSIEQWSDLMFPETGGTDAHLWGSVKSVNADGSYEVQLNASSVTTRCAAGCNASVGDRVLVCIMANGRCAAISKLGGLSADDIGAAAESHNHSAATITDLKSWLLTNVFKVGFVWTSYVNTSPASILGGTWTAITGRFPYFNAGTSTGGSNTHTLTVNQMPSHDHAFQTDWSSAGWSGTSPLGFLTINDGAAYGYGGALNAIHATNTGLDIIHNAGGSGSHNNMPAYQTLYAWRRTA